MTEALPPPLPPIFRRTPSYLVWCTTLRCWHSAYMDEGRALTVLEQVREEFPGAEWALLPFTHGALRRPSFTDIRVRQPRKILAIKKPFEPPQRRVRFGYGLWR